MTYDPDLFETSAARDAPPIRHPGVLDWSNIGTGTKAMLAVVILTELLFSLAWATSFSLVNAMGEGVFLADYLPFPLPEILQDLSVGSVINLVLGLLAVTTPAVIWHFTLRDRILRDPIGYFEGNILRIVVATILIATYASTIALEVLSLLSRIDSSLNTGPLDLLETQPELIPLALVSAALILGSCLLGLASAALSLSISND